MRRRAQAAACADLHLTVDLRMRCGRISVGRTRAQIGETHAMLLKRRAPRIDKKPPTPTKGFEHLDDKAVAVIRWLNANRVDFVLVGPVAAAVRGHGEVDGPVAIVPAPYRRNFERLTRALWSARARLRIEGGDDTAEDTWPVKMTTEKLARGQRWTLRCGTHDLDIETQPEEAPGYQELLYEANRFDLAADVGVEVAAPEDIERYEYIRRTGTVPEIRITRQSRIEQDSG
jgi:hypothetical protein